MCNLYSLRNKYLSIPEAAKASLWFVVCSVLQKGISLITTPIFTRLLTTEEYGVFSLYQTWYSIIYIFATLELTAGVYNKGLAKYKSNRDQFTSSMVGLSAACTILLFCLLALCHKTVERLTGLSKSMLIIMFLDMLVFPSVVFWSLRERFEFKYRALVCVTLGMSILSPLCGILFIKLSQGHAMARILSVAIINILFGLTFFGKLVKTGKTLFIKEYWKYALVFNIPLIPHYLSGIVLGQADRIMINDFFGESSVAIYSVGYSISMLMQIVTSSVNATFVPWTYQKCEDNDYLSIRRTSTHILILIAILSFIPSLLAPEIYMIIAPREYAEGVYVIPPVAASVFFIFLYTLYCNIEFAFEKTRFVTFATTIAGLSNIFLNYFFMKRCGYIAAAYTTLFCYILLGIAHYAFYRKVIREEGIEPVYNDNIFAAISCAVTIGSLLCVWLYRYSLLRFALLGTMFVAIIIKKKDIKRILLQIKR